jgi:cytochrome c-type biogenesis protein CcmH/NrfG
MFFPRLRRQAKWMFVFLALVFAFGFVVFGVGSGLPSGLGDILRGTGTAGGQVSASDAREKIRENPKNAIAYKELGQALLTDGKTEEAIAPLEQYTRMRPRDEDALGQLAQVYFTRATVLQQEVIAAQLQLQEASAGALFAPGLQTKTGQPVGTDRIAENLTAQANERYNASLTKMQRAYSQAVGAYKRLAKLSPDDPSVQLQLAQTAEAGGDVDSALAAYERFLKLAPDDSSAPLVKQRIQLLKAQANAGSLRTAGG